MAHGMDLPQWHQGRGSPGNPANRFESLSFSRDEYDPDQWNVDELPAPSTEFLDDTSKSVISTHRSPDLPFQASVNPYRGCEHGCSYCYARPYHEYLGMSAGLDFESKILVKRDAPRLLRQELSSPRWTPQVLNMSGVTDCYQPAERTFRITRACLEVLAEFCQPVAVITKNRLVARDADLLAELARHRCALVTMSITSLRQDLAQRLEPRASVPAARLDAIRILSQAGIPVWVNVAPIIPGLNDHEIPAILTAARDAGATYAGYTVARLPHAVQGLFSSWLDHHEPAAKHKILSRIADCHGGTLDDDQFGRRMEGAGPHARLIADQFRLACRRHGLRTEWPEFNLAAFRPPYGRQLSLFDG